MKVKVISRDQSEYERSTKGDIHKMQTNVDPKLHPLEGPREYKRALNAIKLERVFAKPFVGSLDGHRDGVFTMSKHPTKLGWLLSGACDGEVRLWDLSTRTCLQSTALHRGFVQGICCTPSGDHFISVGQDKTIRIQSLAKYTTGGGGSANPSSGGGGGRIDVGGGGSAGAGAGAADDSDDEEEEAVQILSKNFFTGVDHHRRQDMFATSGPVVDLWSMHRSEPLNTFSWGADTVTSVKFNPVEVNVLATTADDRNIALYDCRAATPIRKVIMRMRTNAICWNPMEAFNFTCANEDHNLYTFDMRNLDKAKNVHKDHVSAVLDIDYSPTGKQFVSGAYDRTMRIFEFNGGHSNEIYHTKRMQRIFSVKWSSDAKYVLSGSDEMNIRLWKAKAHEHIGTQSARQSAAQKYNDSLKERFKYHPEVRRIAKHRHVPKEVYVAKREKQIMEAAAKRKAANIRKTPSKKQRAEGKGPAPFAKERGKAVLHQVE